VLLDVKVDEDSVLVDRVDDVCVRDVVVCVVEVPEVVDEVVVVVVVTSREQLARTNIGRLDPTIAVQIPSATTPVFAAVPLAGAADDSVGMLQPTFS
jgi:hypothetical protein